MLFLNFVCLFVSTFRFTHFPFVHRLTDFVPEVFFRATVRVGGEQHLIFATDGMLSILANAKIW